MKARLWKLAQVAGCISVALLLGNSMSSADLISLNATYLNTGFTASGGAHGVGVLTISDIADLVAEDSGGQTTYDNVSVLLTASLLSDTSSGGLASGQFDSGTLLLKDSSDAVLFSGTTDELVLSEVSGIPDLLGGQGLFIVTGGSLASSFGAPSGQIVQLTFRIQPSGISNFSSSFTAQTDMTLMPIPEPATLVLLGSGLACLSGVVRRRRS